MTIRKKTVYTIIFLITLFVQSLYSQNSDKVLTINYYGLISSDLDANMSKMASDLYYTQLCEIQSLIINDNRNNQSVYENFESITFANQNLNLYFKVNKIENSTKWLLTIFLQDTDTNKTNLEEKEFDSFYKILMEPKSSLQNFLKKLIYNKNDSIKIAESENNSSSPPIQTGINNISTEEFSGTWSGEDYVDKIVILRGGRGFVIFNNGASMNISVSIQKSNSFDSLIITQTSRTNASFFPNLDRKIALASANSAPPIQWNFKIVDTNTLYGSKKTLVQSSDGTSAEEGEETVTWSRKS